MARRLLPRVLASMAVPTIVLFPFCAERGDLADGVVQVLLRRRGTVRAFAVRDSDPLPLLLRQWCAGVFVVVTNPDLRARVRKQMIEGFQAQAGRYQEMIVHAMEDDLRGLMDQITATERDIGGRLPGLAAS